MKVTGIKEMERGPTLLLQWNGAFHLCWPPVGRGKITLTLYVSWLRTEQPPPPLSRICDQSYKNYEGKERATNNHARVQQQT
jgi:hypothetical protein